MLPHPFSISEKIQNVNIKEESQATVSWDRKGPLLVDFLPRGGTINAAAYCETLKRLH
jgi:hypothetical protein